MLEAPPDKEQPSLEPWLGLGLAATGLPVALLSLLVIVALLFRRGTAPVWLYGLLGAALLGGYAGLWLLLRASTPRSVLVRLGLGLGSLLSVAWGLGAPPLILALMLVALGALLTLTSGPILFFNWVARQDRAAQRRPPPE